MSEVTCDQCGHRNPADAHYCSSCGTSLHRGGEEPPTVTFHPDPGSGDPEIELDADDVPSTGMLVVRRGPNAGSRFALGPRTTTVGRHPDSDVFLDDITVSRRHVELTADQSGFQLADAGSLNGTYVNRRRVESARLESGDEVQVGRFKLVFVTGTGD